jgi:hypothetical protein
VTLYSIPFLLLWAPLARARIPTGESRKAVEEDSRTQGAADGFGAAQRGERLGGRRCPDHVRQAPHRSDRATFRPATVMAKRSNL